MVSAPVSDSMVSGLGSTCRMPSSAARFDSSGPTYPLIKMMGELEVRGQRGGGELEAIHAGHRQSEIIAA